MPTLVRNIHRGHAEAFVERLLETRKPATASNRYRGLQQFFNFLVDEGEIDQSPMERMKPLTVPEQPPPVLRETGFRALLAASSGRTFEDRRDTAIIRALIDTGARLSELTNLAYDRTDPDRSDASQLWVTRKGRRPRVLPVGVRPAQALDRYLRVRDRHALADLPWLWIGTKGAMTPSGIRQMIERRADQAGLAHVNPHRFRHTFAHQWLSSGGNEGDLMNLTGWKSRGMLQRYAAGSRSRWLKTRVALRSADGQPASARRYVAAWRIHTFGST